MGGARQLLRKLSRLGSLQSRLPPPLATFFHGSSQHRQELYFLPHSQRALHLHSSDNEENHSHGAPPSGVLQKQLTVADGRTYVKSSYSMDMTTGVQKKLAIADGRTYVKSSYSKHMTTGLRDLCLSSRGFPAVNMLSKLRAGGTLEHPFHTGLKSRQGVSMVRFSSTSTDHHLEGDTAEVFNVGTVDGATTLTTSKAQAISEVSAVIGDCSYPTAFLQLFLENVHLYTGLPWWATIVATTIGIRLMCLPVVFYQLRAAAKLSLMRPEMEKINEEIKGSHYDPVVAMAGRERMTALFAKHKTSPLSPFVGALLQMPIFMSFFFGIRNMADRVDSFKEGGALWFTDLSVVDSTYILPMVLAGSMLLSVELNAAEGMEGNPFADKMKNFMRIFCVILFPISLNFETALFCYWITSTYFSLVQSTLCKHPRVKEYLNIPSTAHLAAAPTQALVAAATSAATPLETPAQSSNGSRAKPIGRRRSRGIRRR